MIGNEMDLDAALRGLVDDPPSIDDARPAARDRLWAEIRSTSPKRVRRRWRHGWIIGAVAVGLATPVALAATGQFDGGPPVYRSNTDPAVYSLDPISDQMARSIATKAKDGGDSASGITTGEIDYCLKTEELGRVDPFCAVTLAAYRDGNLDPIPGDDPGSHEVACTAGIELLPQEKCTPASAGRIDEPAR